MSETKNLTISTVRSVALRTFATAAVALSLLTAAYSPALAVPVDINSAGVAELAGLPGIGESKAESIVEERNRKRFESVDDLERVSGIGPKTLAQLREHVTVDPAPVFE